jgi:hypothetical protein
MITLHDRLEGRFVSIAEILLHVAEHPLPNGMIVPTLLWGARGTGKTKRVRAYALSRGLRIIEYHPSHDESGADLVGDRAIREGRTERYLPSWLPAPDDRDGGVLFIDELNRAPKGVRDGLLELFGEGSLSEAGYRLPRGWQIVGAANPADMAHDTEQVDAAMIDRFLHVPVAYDAAAWARWADEARLGRRVIDFALMNPDLVDSGEAGLPLGVLNSLRATPRSLEYFARLTDNETPPALLSVIAHGLLGREAAEVLLRQWDSLAALPPLRFEDILAGKYKRALEAWKDSPNRRHLVIASNEYLIGGLMDLEPSDELLVTVGDYLSRISSSEQEAFFESCARSAYLWVAPLQGMLQQWREYQERLRREAAARAAER